LVEDDVIKAIQDRLVACGMREYSAKVYTTLFSVGIAKAAELHELTDIPRGRIYETLDDLSKQGFVTEFGTNPVYYRADDAERTYLRVLSLEMQRLDKLRTCLLDIQNLHRPYEVSGITEFHTPKAISTQVELKLKRIKSELLVVCNDKETLHKYADIIAETAKRIPVYLVVLNDDIAQAVPIKCYMTNDTLQRNLMQVSFFTGKETLPFLIYFYCDRSSTMGILRSNNEEFAFLQPSDVYAEFVVKNFLKTIKPVK
jgi:sugar-specific transcriptional regulator TrmB